jgi:hypothetical protein
MPGFDQPAAAPAPPQQSASAYPGFDPAATPFARPTGLNLGIGTPAYSPGTAEMDIGTGLARSPGFNLTGMQQEQRVRQRGPLVLDMTPPAGGTMPVPPAGTAPLGTVTGQDLPAPGSTSSILTPPQIQRTMGAQALYNQPPPGMTLPPGVTQQDVGRLGFGATNIDPSKAPVQRYGSGVGKYAGAALGALKGLAGGPLGAAVGGYLGYQGGKRVGGLLGDRDFGLGARFSNPNYPQGVVANPPDIMDMGVPPITQPAQTPIIQADTGGGIFGQGRSMVGGAAQKILSAVRSGAMSIEAGAKAMSMPVDKFRDSLDSMGSGGRGMGGMGGLGGGDRYSGGNYGGYGGSRINEGIGQRFGNR